MRIAEFVHRIETWGLPYYPTVKTAITEPFKT